MHILYFFIVKIAEWILPVLAFLSKNKKLKQFVSGRKHLFSNLQLSDNPNRYWFHCASLGEFEQARPVMESLKEKNPAISIVISFFSPSGFEQKKNYSLAEAVFYLPLDTPANARKLIVALQPKAVVFVKYEIWYFYLKSLFSHQIPVYLISANFRKDQKIFSIWGQWLFNLLPQYRQIFLQNESSFGLLKSKGLKNITLSGDTRYDRVMQNAVNFRGNDLIQHFKGNKKLIIAGSSWPTEEAILLAYLQLDSPEMREEKFKIIIVPHDISEKHILEIMDKFRFYQPFLYTENDVKVNGNLMILNTIGHLADAYQYADMALVGGGFTGQLHNILEPLAFGVPVITGPVHIKFPEAAMAKHTGVLFEIMDATSLEKTIMHLDRNNLSLKAKLFVSTHSGATELVVNSIL